MSGQKPPRSKMKCVRIGPPGGCLLDSEEESGPPPKQLLPPAPTVNLPVVIPNTSFTPVPITTLPAAAPPPPPQGTYTEMLQNLQPIEMCPIAAELSDIPNCPPAIIRTSPAEGGFNKTRDGAGPAIHHPQIVAAVGRPGTAFGH